ncbi:MAG: hypothetical protein NTX69_05390 [Candidatus Bipolaricaulota bacterium]|nr:hypothetical protein [Candidatus Bipolaricaulota bacterium]
MSRIVLVHWNAAEAEERAERLRRAGHDVACHTDAKANPRVLLAIPPDAFLIDLARLPSQGRELGGFLRRAASTRAVPLVFVAGDPTKTEAVRSLLPDAAYTTWDRALADLPAAIAAAPARPSIPGAMDAYAGVPLAKKLGMRPSSTLLLLGAPSDFERTLGPLPASVRITRATSQPSDVVLFFAQSHDLLEAGFDGAATHVQDGGRLWILWRKRQARGATQGLTQAGVRAFGLARGWVDYKVSAIDETWSGLCFARRKAGREAR